MDWKEVKELIENTNPDNKKSVENFRKGICKFYLEVFKEVFKQAGVELPEDFEKNREKDVDNGKCTKIEIKIKKQENKPDFPFNQFFLPLLRKGSMSASALDYCVIRNTHSDLFKRKKGKLYASGIGVEFTKDKKINVGLFCAYEGKGEEGEIKKVNDWFKKKKYLEEVDLNSDLLKKAGEKLKTLIDEAKKNGKKWFNEIYESMEKEIPRKGVHKTKKEREEILEEEGQNKNSPNHILHILTALNTKPFLILAGVSGTGKTQIARIIANVMSEEEERRER